MLPSISKKIAVQYGFDDFMTYGDLDRSANKAAVALRQAGVSSATIVPICMTLAYPFHGVRDTQPGYVPVGRPVGWTSVYMLDPDSEKLVPIGAVGELCIAGPQAARGYLNDDVKTRAKSIPDPFAEGSMMYRAGDLARLHGDGLFECLGRIDAQIKVRGLRIETGEVEAVIATNKTIKQAKVLKTELANEVERLVAFVVSHSNDLKDSSDDGVVSHALDADLANRLWSTMEGKLTAYMLPFLPVRVSNMPIPQNEKLDERKLQGSNSSLDWAGRTAFSQIAAAGSEGVVETEPENETQSKLRALWAHGALTRRDYDRYR